MCSFMLCLFTFVLFYVLFFFSSSMCFPLKNFFFFFFKQKTAYDMRISDWSSDVCSSDLRNHFPAMCGRFYQTSDPTRLRDRFGTANAIPNLQPRFKSAPTQALAVVRYDPEAGERSLDLLRWDLIPRRAKDPAIGNKLINAREEAVAAKPAFRDTSRRRFQIPNSVFRASSTALAQDRKSTRLNSSH